MRVGLHRVELDNTSLTICSNSHSFLAQWANYRRLPCQSGKAQSINQNRPLTTAQLPAQQRLTMHIRAMSLKKSFCQSMSIILIFMPDALLLSSGFYCFTTLALHTVLGSEHPFHYYEIQHTSKRPALNKKLPIKTE